MCPFGTMRSPLPKCIYDFFLCGLGMINLYLGYLVFAETCEDDEWGALSE
jgi:hypothetical protein